MTETSLRHEVTGSSNAKPTNGAPAPLLYIELTNKIIMRLLSALLLVVFYDGHCGVYNFKQKKNGR
jgi:hypothetical protein